jgi:hypothetical protein
MLNEKHICANLIHRSFIRCHYMFRLTSTAVFVREYSTLVTSQDGCSYLNACREMLRWLVQLSATGAVVHSYSSQSSQYCSHHVSALSLEDIYCWACQLLLTITIADLLKKKIKLLCFRSTIISLSFPLKLLWNPQRGKQRFTFLRGGVKGVATL